MQNVYKHSLFGAANDVSSNGVNRSEHTKMGTLCLLKLTLVLESLILVNIKFF